MPATKQNIGSFKREFGDVPKKEEISRNKHTYFSFDFRAFFESKENYLDIGQRYYDFETEEWEIKN